jgi:hypothetical protein
MVKLPEFEVKSGTSPLHVPNLYPHLGVARVLKLRSKTGHVISRNNSIA